MTDSFFILQNLLGSGSMLSSDWLVYLRTSHTVLLSRLLLIAHVSYLSTLPVAHVLVSTLTIAQFSFDFSVVVHTCIC